ncbi:MAG: hypothetical protein IJ759_02955 [Bacteroidales bacterium]|nr:hypothetical protein [Bacteroidales bacterium]
MEELIRKSTIVDVQWTAHLRHSDVPETEHRDQQFKVHSVFDASTGLTQSTITPRGLVSLANMSGLLCILFGKDDVPKSNKIITSRQQRESEIFNLLELSPEGYTARWRYDFAEGYAEKIVRTFFDSEKNGTMFYNATVESWHCYPKDLSSDVIRILPNDIAVVNSENTGELLGRTILRWLKEDGEILSCNASVDIVLNNSRAQLEHSQLFSYEYRHDDVDTLPFTMQVKGEVCCIDEEIEETETTTEENN